MSGAGERGSLPRRRPATLAQRLAIASIVWAIACGGVEEEDSRSPIRIVGEVEAPADGPLWAPVDLAVSADRLWVADAGAAVVQVYDREGRHRATVGGKGRGPGELLDPLAVGVVGDTLWVLNTGNRRVEWFGLEGAPLGSIPLADSVPPLVDLVRFRDRWYGTSPFGSSPVLHLARRAGELALVGASGHEMAERANERRIDSVQGVYRMVVVGDRLWLLHAYLPLAASIDSTGRLVDLVEYAAAAVKAGRVEVQKTEGRTRRVRSAPERSAGALGILEVDGVSWLLTRQRSSDGRQRMIALDEAFAGGAVRHGPPGALLTTADTLGGRVFAAGTWGEAGEPAVLVIETSSEEKR